MILHPPPTLELTYFKIDLGKKRGSVPGANKHHMDYIKGFPLTLYNLHNYFKKGLDKRGQVKGKNLGLTKAIWIREH